MYGGTPAEVQAVFTMVLELVVPPDRKVDIRDWGSPGLLNVCPDYFQPGTDWWGVFLFTLCDAQNKHVTVIAGAATD
jgi:hypothetical protein